MNVRKIFDETNSYRKPGKAALYLSALEVAAWMTANDLRDGPTARTAIIFMIATEETAHLDLTAADFRDVAAKARRVVLGIKTESAD